MDRLVYVRCWKGDQCVLFGMPEWLEHARQVDHQTFYCPLGHPNHYPAGKTESERLRDQLNAEIAYSKRKSEALEREKRLHAATKGELTKTKNRIANGVCPCCNRSFAQLTRHMKSQHPEYVGEGNA